MVDVRDRGDVGVKLCPLCSSPVPSSADTCPTCGAPLDAAATGGMGAAPTEFLPPGTLLNDGSFSVGKVLGRGGFAITYLGADLRLKRAVAIKEFFPAGTTRRGTSAHFSSALSRQEYDLAIQKFMQEAQMLARFRHRSIVNVYEVFQANDTAYMVMEYLQGENLMERMERRGHPLEEGELVAITQPIAEALDEVHAAGVLHRDIKPENIMLVGPENDPRPVLIDFGAAREFASGMANRHSIVLTPGYAPLEQYGEQARRGPFTDVYALAATLYHVSTGEQPAAATERALGVALKSPRSLNPRLSEAFDAALMHGLEMKVDERPQTAMQFYKELAGGSAPRIAPAAEPSPSPFDWVPPSPQRPPPSPPPPSPAVPTPGTHLDRVRQIARQVTGMGVVQTDHFLCPVCRSANMLDASGTVAGTRCPVCRAAVLAQRFTSAEMLLCPSCSSGTLAPMATSKLRPDAMMRCPACRTGSVVSYVRPQMLIVPDLWAKCNSCGADFDYHTQTDSLTLDDLPGGPGYLSPDSVGQTRTRSEWAQIAGDGAAGRTCPVCSAEFRGCENGDLEWVAVGDDPQRVPREHRGVCRTPAAWAKIAHHLAANRGTVACPNCDAQFDQSTDSQLTLLGGAHDPYGVLGQFRGKTYSAATWRALATERRKPAVPGLVCPSCTAEMQRGRRDNEYALAWYDPARDPHGTGSHYGKRTLQTDDWRRIAAGGVPRNDEQRLREEAYQEFWKAMLSGEVSTSIASESYPGTVASDEKVVITFAALQIRSRFGFMYEHDTGHVWLTTRKVLYAGGRGDVTVLLKDAGGCDLLDMGRGSQPLVEIQGKDGRPQLRFIMGSGPIQYDIDSLALEVNWDERAFVELFESLRRRA